jgi:hypothetical protein
MCKRDDRIVCPIVGVDAMSAPAAREPALGRDPVAIVMFEQNLMWRE